MCGPDQVDWEAIAQRLQDGVYGIIGRNSYQEAKHTAEGTVIAKYDFPDTEYRSPTALREEWRSKDWDRTLYNLLYKSRRYEATIPKDRIYAFPGLASDIQFLSIVPDYSTLTSKVFIDVTRTMIAAHRHLLVLNMKREPVARGQQNIQQSQLYSLLDQARFFDPNGLMVSENGRSVRKGWVRLPHGWERRQNGPRFEFYNHLTGKCQEASPLTGQSPAPPQHMDHWCSLPPGWTKAWDNLGNTKFVFNQEGSKTVQADDFELENLPSWVPDWTKRSSRDPEPFPSLIHDEARYWASGKASQAQFAAGPDADSNVLTLTGVFFDDIASIAQSWCPELHLLPIDRLQNKILQAWEVLAMAPVPSCPYEDLGGRYNAYWRIHIAN